MSTYCAKCDRQNGRSAKFCGGCGQSLKFAHEAFSFPLWLIVIISSSIFIPLTFYALAVGHEYIAVHAYNIVMNEASIHNLLIVALVLLSYSVLVSFLCRQFPARKWMRLYRYVQLSASCVGIAIAGYWLIHTIRAWQAGEPIATHTVLTLASQQQMTTIAYYTMSYYATFLLFYTIVLQRCIKKDAKDVN